MMTVRLRYLCSATETVEKIVWCELQEVAQGVVLWAETEGDNPSRLDMRVRLFQMHIMVGGK